MQERAEPRKARAEDIKRLEEHIAQFKDVQFGIETHMLDKVKGLAPDGWSYAWILSSIYGEPHNRINEKQATGWIPVPASRHPGLFLGDSVDGRRTSNGNIEYKGVTLCEKATVLCEMEKKSLEKIAMSRATSIPEADRYMGDPHMQARFTVNPELTRSSIPLPVRY